MSKTKISGKTLAIQLGRDETQILLVNGTELIHGITVETPAGAVEDGMIRNADAVREMLKTAVKTPEFKNVRQTVFTLCTSQVITDVITAPDLPAAKLEKLLQANVDMYFPVDMHDYQLAWEVIGPKVSESGLKEVNVQLWAMPTSMISRYYQVANAAGLSVAAIDYIGSSIANAIGASFSKPSKAAKAKKRNLNPEIKLGKKKAAEETPAEEAEEVIQGADTQLHLLLEKDILGMTFVQNGQVVLQRFIRCGNDPSYQFGELAMMLEYFENMDIGRGCAIEGIAAGALAEDDSVVQELADLLGISVRRFSASYDLRWFLCMGAVRTTKDFGTPSLNKPGTAKRQFQSELWQYGLMLAGGLAVLAVVMFLLSSRLTWNTELSVLQNEQNMLTMQNAQVSGYADNYYEYESMYNNYNTDWDTVFNSLYTHNDNLVLVLEELEGMMPKTTSVTQMQIMANGLNISFASPDKEEAAYVIMKLREMGYADLMAVSNLAGGGNGPATSYGSGTNKEAAPTVGSSTTLDKEALFNMAMGLSEEQFQLLWDTYGNHPESTDASNTLAAVKGSVTKDQRDEALETLLNTNPFAINWFKELLLKDFQSSDESILYPHIVLDLLKMGILQNGLPDTFEESKALLDKLVAALTDDTKPQKLEATETLFCTHRDMELAYLYHVKLAAGMRGDAGELYYLNIDKITRDIANGGSKTGDPQLDEMINALFPHLDIPTEPSEPDPNDVYVDTIGASLKDYLASYTSADATVRELLDGYLTAGTTGNSKLDTALDSDVSSGKVDEELKTLLKKHRGGEKTNNAAIDGLVSGFLTNMDVKNPALKQQLIVCLMSIGGEPVDPTDPTLPADPTVPTVPTEPTTPVLPTINFGQLFADYLSKGTTGDAVMDDLIEKYLTTGTTGDPEADKEIIDFVINGNVDLDYKKLADFYLQGIIDGKISPSDDTLKIIIGVVVGSSGLNRDTLSDAYIKMYEKVWDKVYEEGGDILPTVPTMPSVNILKMGEYFVDFINDGTSGNAEADTMCESFLLTGTTGNSSADLVILNYILKEDHDLDYNKLVDYYQDAFASGKISLNNLDNDFIKGVINAILNEGINEESLKKLFQDMYEKLFDENVQWPEATEPTKPGDPDEATKPTEPPKDIEEYYGVFFNYFLANDTTTTLAGNPAFEELLGRKLSKEAYELIDEDCRNYIKGTIKDTKKAQAITTYINGGGIDDTLKRRMADYRAGKNYSQDEVIHTMLAWFLANCDYPNNNVLEVRMTLMLTQLANDANKGASQKPQAQQDTRIHFTVLLNYNDNLRQEELNRKGLDYSDKIAPLEVAE